MKSNINGFESVEDRLNWCEGYIKILLTEKDDTRKQINQLKEDLSKANAKIFSLGLRS